MMNLEIDKVKDVIFGPVIIGKNSIGTLGYKRLIGISTEAGGGGVVSIYLHSTDRKILENLKLPSLLPSDSEGNARRLDDAMARSLALQTQTTSVTILKERNRCKKIALSVQDTARKLRNLTNDHDTFNMRLGEEVAATDIAAQIEDDTYMND